MATAHRAAVFDRIIRLGPKEIVLRETIMEKALRKYRFRTRVYGDVTIYESSYDCALEEFLRQGYLETDIVEIC
jgi:hypothetical protein